MTIAINGGIQSIDESQEHLQHVDGVMLGRAAYQRPYLLSAVDASIFGVNTAPKSRAQVLTEYRQHVADERKAGTPLGRLIRPLLGLYHGQPGGRVFRRLLSEGSHDRAAGLEVYDAAVEAVRSRSEHAPDGAAA